MNVASAKSQVTRTCNTLDKLVEKIHANVVEYKATPTADLHTCVDSVLADIITLETTINRGQLAMKAFEEASERAANQKDPSDEELAAMEKYAEKFAEAIERAQETMTELIVVESRHRRSLEEALTSSESQIHEAPQNDCRFIVEKSTLPLPKLRKFGGDRLQYSSFRTLFREMIDRSGQNNLLKLNHLMESLTGEALHLVSKLSMTGENFEIAMELLDKKYGDSRKIISTLVRNLQNSKAASDKTKDQRELLDTIQINIRQLNDLKEPLDTVIMQDMVIQKFARRIQATVFKKRISVRLTDDQKVQDESTIQATSWNLEKILEHLEEIISMEEELEEHMSPKPDHKPDNNGKKNGNSDEKPTKAEPKSGKDKNKKYCFACKLETHWSSDCPTFPDPKQRTALLIADDRCTQCGRKGHLTNQCRKPACKVCQQPGLLRSNCPERTSSPKVAENGNNNSNSKKPTDGAKTNNGKPQTVAVVTRKEEADSEFIRTTAFQGSEGFKEEIAIIPTVKVKALNPRTQQWQNVSLMLDTGADTSYITAQLQEDWDLPILESKTFAIRTFGDPNPTLKVRQRTEISLLTMRNKVFTVTPYIQPSLVGVIRKNPISPKDIRYAQLLELDVNEQCYEAKVEPDIIIGGDYFTRMTHGTHHTLPSGITLLDTIFGNTMMGVPFDDETLRESPEPIREKYQFSIVQDSEYMSERNTEESQRKDMQMKAPGEHTGPLSEEITATEELTWQHFKNTVEKRPEGYFVRLHFKENHPPLPDNYAIAIRRLQSVGRNHSREVLQMIDNVFQDQIEKGIVEAVVEPRNSKPGIHYNAHQPVLTPTKTTTKCRVVIDGSSHFKGKPSLNDIIHQGPTILPDLVHLILRFRSGSIALVSDVEKAFLQVFLHEDDRDYTRVLWVKDIDAPFSGENIIELRFTRVLFGLNISPFLLGATILHHFEQLEDKELANEMSKNLYVDNLILTTDKDPEDAISLYRGAKQAFSEMSMNLREFQTNSSELADQIDTVDRAKEIEMKIMGIKWDSQLDVLIMGVHIDYLDENSRRTVSSSIAIQFDPHGLLSPILLPMRLFQRELWEDEFNYNWDTTLIEDHEKRWTELVNAANNFTIQVPRQVTRKTKDNFIVTFTDASKDATACCTYVVNDIGSHIIFGKSKIKPLKEVFTIPKLEMQALKMGTEKTAEVIKALQDGKIIVTKVFIFSDSTIALSWLKGQPSQKEVGIFVRNRLAAIRAASEKIEALTIPVQFGHVTTDQNPADLGTRGIDRENFSRSSWWHGPKFLEDDPSQWTNHGLFSISEPSSELIRQVRQGL